MDREVERAKAVSTILKRRTSLRQLSERVADWIVIRHVQRSLEARGQNVDEPAWANDGKEMRLDVSNHIVGIVGVPVCDEPRAGHPDELTGGASIPLEPRERRLVTRLAENCG
jgi:hypothetical protein